MSAPGEAARSEPWKPRVNPWLIAVSVMLPTFMEVLDTSIASVALPYIAGNLGATQEESTWVLTSYLVSNAIVLPTSAWFSSFFGRKRFLISFSPRPLCHRRRPSIKPCKRNFCGRG